jgi:hypothetical protein
MMMKRLIVWYPHLAADIESRKNVYDCPHPKELFDSEEMKKLLIEMKSRIENFEVYFNYLYFELEERQRQTPEPDVMEQLNRNWGETFLATYRQALLNYAISLREESAKRLQHHRNEEAL